MSAPVVVSDELRRIVARQRAERPEHDNAPVDLPQMQSAPGKPARPIRYKNRNEQWRSEASRAAAEMRNHYAGAAAEVNKALTDALAEGPDWARVHRGSLFRDPPPNNVDRNHLARIWFVAQMIERKSWACRAKGKHGGSLGTVAMELLRVILFVVRKNGGKLFPSYDTLSILSRKSRQAVITAMKVLVAMGFVTVHRRIKRVMTQLGPKVVQDSNAYEFHLPKRGLGKLAMSIFCRQSSEYTKTVAENHNKQKQGEDTGNTTDRASGEASKGQPKKEVDRWWLDPPLAMGNGGFR